MAYEQQYVAAVNQTGPLICICLYTTLIRSLFLQYRFALSSVTYLSYMYHFLHGNLHLIAYICQYRILACFLLESAVRKVNEFPERCIQHQHWKSMQLDFRANWNESGIHWQIGFRNKEHNTWIPPRLHTDSEGAASDLFRFCMCVLYWQ
jgi:hypothetical protein